MSTPAAILLAKALPKSDPTSMATDSGPSWRGSARGGRGGRGRGSGRGGGVGGRGGALTDDDVGMSDLSEGGGATRRGRSTLRKGPMGDRPTMKPDGKPYDTRRGSARNSPAVLRDDPPRARSTPASSSSANQDPPSSGAIDTLRLFLMSRYSGQDKMLNLENMADDSILKNAGLKAPGEKGAPTNLAKVLWKLVSELFPDIVSLSLANNHLTSILPLSPYIMTSNIPNLQNLSLAANSLGQIRDLDPLSPTVGNPRGDKKPKGWATLRELVLTGNPIAEPGEGIPHYRSEMARRFPTLRQLDQQPIDPSIAFAVPLPPKPTNVTPGISPAAKREQSKNVAVPATVFPVPIAGGFFESEPTRDFVAGFLAKFFAAYDTDRASLAPVYAPECTFSFSIDTTAPTRTRAKKIGAHGDTKFPNQFKLDWKPYLGEGRNLVRVLGPAKRVKALHTAPTSIIEKITTLPTTVHPLTEAPKFVFDSWTMPGMLAPAAPGGENETAIYATVHGEFRELPSKGIRSFNRTFILAPAPAGSPAQLAGWPCVILSDLFCIRGYTDPNAWLPKVPPPTPAPTPSANPVGASGPPAAPAAPLPLPPSSERAEGITDQQQSLVLELQRVTRLTYSFAHLCLVQNGWDAPTALSNFQALQAGGAIPREAFLP